MTDIPDDSVHERAEAREAAGGRARIHMHGTDLKPIGKIDDVLIDKSGKITALIVGVGGFLGMGEKDVALPFSAVKGEMKNDKWYLTSDETKDSLKSAAGYKYNSSTTMWTADK